jgi:hypothetical protein
MCRGYRPGKPDERSRSPVQPIEPNGPTEQLERPLFGAFLARDPGALPHTARRAWGRLGPASKSRSASAAGPSPGRAAAAPQEWRGHCTTPAAPRPRHAGARSITGIGAHLLLAVRWPPRLAPSKLRCPLARGACVLHLPSSGRAATWWQWGDVRVSLLTIAQGRRGVSRPASQLRSKFEPPGLASTISRTRVAFHSRLA